MAFIIDKEVLKTGLIIFRRGDVEHRNFYCRIKLPKEDRYKTISLHTSDRESVRDRAFDQDAYFCYRQQYGRRFSLSSTLKADIIRGLLHLLFSCLMDVAIVTAPCWGQLCCGVCLGGGRPLEFGTEDGK